MIRLSTFKWTAIEKFGQQFFVLFGNIVLARLLSPNDFGLVAVLSVFMGLAWNLTESGLSDWLIRDTRGSKKTYVTASTYNVFVSLFLYTIIFLVSPYIAQLYSKPELTLIARILGLTILMRAFSIVELTLLRKRLQFKDLAIINISSVAIGVTAGILAARSGLGYWSLVLQSIFNSLTPIIVLLLFYQFRPKFLFFKEEYSRMKGFSANMLISYIANQLTQNLSSSLLALVSPISVVGLYNQSSKLSMVFFGSMNTIVLTTSYPLIASLNDIRERKEAYLNVLNKFVFLISYLGLFVFSVSSSLIKLLFGESWLEMIPFFDLMLLSTLVQPLMTVNANILKVENKHQTYRNLSLLRNLLSIMILIFTYRLGVIEMISGQLLAAILSSLLFLVAGCRAVHMTVTTQLVVIVKNLLPPVLLCLFSVHMLSAKCSELLYLFVVLIVFSLAGFLHSKLSNQYKYAN